MAEIVERYPNNTVAKIGAPLPWLALLLVLLIATLPLYGAAKIVYLVFFLAASAAAFLSNGGAFPLAFIPFLMSVLYGFLIGLAKIDVAAFSSALSWLVLLFYVSLFLRVKTEQVLFVGLVLILVFCSVDALVQIVKGTNLFGKPLVAGGRASGPFTWNSPVIGGFAMVLFFVIDKILPASFRLRYLLYLLFISAILAAGTRGALLQVFFCFFIVKFSWRSKIISLACFVSILIPVIGLIATYVESETFLRLIMLTDIERTIEYESRDSGRITFWVEYLGVALSDNWLFGTGIGALENYLYGLTAHYIHPHHLYLEIFLTFGVVGTSLIAFSLFWLYSESDDVGRLVLLSFWGPFNALHSIFDFYWAVMLFTSLGVTFMCRRSPQVCRNG